MIVDKIEEYLLKLHNKETELDLILKNKVKAILDSKVVDASKWMFNPMKRTTDRLYPSDATKCPRQLAMKVLAFPAETIPARLSVTFTQGNFLEAMVMALSSMATPNGIIENNEKFEVMIGGKPRRGATDGLYVDDDQYGKVNVEVKSMTQYAFNEFSKAGLDDTFGYLGQVNVYMRQLVTDKKIDPPGKTCVIAVDKMTGDIAERMLDYDERYAIQADDNFAEIENCLSRKRVPKIPNKNGLTKEGDLGLVCSYCRYKHSCWSKPFQAVKINGVGVPVYSDKTERWVVKYFKSGRFRQKPAFKVKEMDKVLHKEGIDGITDLNTVE
jgi:hypothetical protein